jgi:hypothetical protein
VAEEQTGGSKTADGVTEMVANGKEFGLGGSIHCLVASY